MFNFFKRLFKPKKLSSKTTGYIVSTKASAYKLKRAKTTKKIEVRKNQSLDHCPFAFTKFPRANTKGVYKLMHPVGAVVHYTSGNPDQRLADAVAFQNKSGMTYFCIDASGSISQNFPLTSWGSHAGKSNWDGIGRSVSSSLVGIEVICAGKLSANGTPWFGNAPYPADKVRVIDKDKDNQKAGTYYKFTEAQESSLIRLCHWLKSNNQVFDFDKVLGHDEVSGEAGLGYQRKIDPGASLSMTMPQFRKLLTETYNDDSPRYS